MAEEPVTEEPTAETEVEETGEEQVEETAETQDSETEPSDTEIKEEQVKSERGQKRLQDLANKANKATQLEKEKEELEKKLAQLEPLVTPKQQADPLKDLEDFAPKLTGDYETDLRAVEERATKKAVEKVEVERNRERQLQSDILAAEKDYPELKEGGEDYNEELANEIAGYFREVKALNKDVRLKPVVDRMMKIYRRSAITNSAKTAETILKQQKESAVTPSTTPTPAKSEKDMSLEEIEKLVGTARAY